VTIANDILDGEDLAAFMLQADTDAEELGEEFGVPRMRGESTIVYVQRLREKIVAGARHRAKHGVSHDANPQGAVSERGAGPSGNRSQAATQPGQAVASSKGSRLDNQSALRSLDELIRELEEETKPAQDASPEPPPSETMPMDDNPTGERPRKREP
jgi:hypothetical protein